MNETEVILKVRRRFVDRFLFADRLYEKNELLKIFKEIFDELLKEAEEKLW